MFSILNSSVGRSLQYHHRWGEHYVSINNNNKKKINNRICSFKWRSKILYTYPTYVCSGCDVHCTISHHNLHVHDENDFNGRITTIFHRLSLGNICGLFDLNFRSVLSGVIDSIDIIPIGLNHRWNNWMRSKINPTEQAIWQWSALYSFRISFLTWAHRQYRQHTHTHTHTNWTIVHFC